MKTGTLLIRAWQQKSINYFEYINLCKQIGKTEALKKHIPIMEYINIAYERYIYYSYSLGIKTLKKGEWLRSTPLLENINHEQLH